MFPPSLLQGLVISSSLLSVATACVKVGAEGHTGIGSGTVRITLWDNGKQICHGQHDSNGDDGTIHCTKGHHLSYHWGEIDGPLSLNYKTRHGRFKFDVANTGCSITNCCGGTIPCSCADCHFFQEHMLC